MKVIALVGAENSGKSHTINVVYSLLLASGYTQVQDHFRTLGNPKNKDFIDILEKDDKKVGFVGMGDYTTGIGKSLESLLDELKNNGCDVTICACRNNPKIVAAVKNYASHFIVSKTLSTGSENDRIVNVADAITMITYI